MDVRKDIGQRLADLRKEKGLSQRQLEAVSGIGHSHIARIENGQYNVRIDIVERIASALGHHLEIV